MPSEGGVFSAEAGRVPFEGVMPHLERGIRPSEGGIRSSEGDIQSSYGSMMLSEGGISHSKGGTTSPEGGIMPSREAEKISCHRWRQDTF